MIVYYRKSWVDATNSVRMGEGELEKFEGSLGDLYRDLKEECGRCTGFVYIDKKDHPAMKVGWVFVKRMPYDERESYGHRLTKKNTFLQETWVTCYDGPVVVVRPGHLEIA